MLVTKRKWNKLRNRCFLFVQSLCAPQSGSSLLILSPSISTSIDNWSAHIDLSVPRSFCIIGVVCMSVRPLQISRNRPGPVVFSPVLDLLWRSKPAWSLQSVLLHNVFLCLAIVVKACLSLNDAERSSRFLCVNRSHHLPRALFLLSLLLKLIWSQTSAVRPSESPASSRFSSFTSFTFSSELVLLCAFRHILMTKQSETFLTLHSLKFLLFWFWAFILSCSSTSGRKDTTVWVKLSTRHKLQTN